MSKNLKLSYIFAFVLTMAIVAWKTLYQFFNGVGINYMIVLVMIALMLCICLGDKETYARFKDIFVISCVFAIFETVVYFPYEFGACSNSRVATVFFNFQNVFTLLGFFFIAYIAFRLIAEAKNIKFHFIEVMLGSEDRYPRTEKAPKLKKAKELTNGSLEEKPNQVADAVVETEDEEIVIKSLEEFDKEKHSVSDTSTSSENPQDEI